MCGGGVTNRMMEPLRGILLVTGLFVLALIALVERHRERIGPWLTGLISGRLAALKKG